MDTARPCQPLARTGSAAGPLSSLARRFELLLRYSSGIPLGTEQDVTAHGASVEGALLGDETDARPIARQVVGAQVDRVEGDAAGFWIVEALEQSDERRPDRVSCRARPLPALT
jgi:hypothetical protein